MARVTLLSDGPSKFDLMLALFDRKPSQNLRTVQFSLEESSIKTITVVIHSVSIEDGSGECWLFTGLEKTQDYRRIKGYFRTDRREGHFEYVD
jgi:hypothetical protein